MTETIASPETEDYARNWRFQLVVFAIVRLPFLIAALVPVVMIEVGISRRWSA